MRRAVALCGLLAALSLILAWELTAPDQAAGGHQSRDASGLNGASRAMETRSPPSEFNAGALADVAAPITERPLFSPDRRPSGGPAAAAATTAVDLNGLPRLTGTIVGPSGARAIFAGSDGKSRVAAEGDAVGDFKVLTIGAGVVTLSGPDGDRVLRPTYVLSSAASGVAGRPDAVQTPRPVGNVPLPGRMRGPRSRELSP